MSLADAVGVLRQVASALDYAHGEKVVHRDVKPGNVMIDGKGRVKVLDFGLAAQIRTSLSRASHAYRGTSGTGPYMAPEQWRAQPQDAKTDQYALGVMAYEMLAGRLPFENPELAVLKYAVLNGEVAGIPVVPEGAMAAIRRAMGKRAEERFGSCGEFVEALEGKRVVGGKGEGRGEGNRPTVRPGQNSDAATAGRQGGDGDVFLRKVRVGKALEEAGREDATAGEKAELGRVRVVFAAGEEAMRAGERAAAGALFGQAEEGLAVWRTHLAARREAEAERRAEERRLEEARRRREEARKARERAEEAARKEENRKRAKEMAERRKRRWSLAAKVAGALGVVWLLVWVAGGIGRIVALQRTRAEVAGLGAGTRAGEVQAITLPGGANVEMVWCPDVSGGMWMGKTEVTQKQWRSVMGNKPSLFKGDDLPVESVSWNDCQEFCRKTGLRLPTEEEWEMACRAGAPKSEAYCKLSDGRQITAGNLSRVAWYGKERGAGPTRVGSLESNAWGLHDMHGNVWEWTETAVGGFRVLRGGSFYGTADVCTAGLRHRRGPDDAFWYLGFRLAASGMAATG